MRPPLPPPEGFARARRRRADRGYSKTRAGRTVGWGLQKQMAERPAVSVRRRALKAQRAQHRIVSIELLLWLQQYRVLEGASFMSFDFLLS